MVLLDKSVLLLKSQKSEGDIDQYEQILEKEGYKVLQVKTLDFKYIHLEVLSRKLDLPEDYSGIILSSPRCVTAVKLALNGKPLNGKWKGLCNFVVGQTTEKAALNELNLECRGSETGNANNLAEKIIKEKSKFQRPFLFPHGNLKTDTLKRHFSEVGLELDETLVYETMPNLNLKSEILSVTCNFSKIPSYVVFFSPSGVESSIDIIRDGVNDFDRLKFIAIGPVTEDCLKHKKLPVYGVAERPTAEEVLKVIKQ